MYEDIFKNADKLNYEIIENAPMSKFTSFKTGGNASILIIPRNIDTIGEIVNLLKNNNIKPLVIGNGSNLLISDKGYKGVVIKFGNKLSNIKLIDDNKIYCEAGASMKALCNFALDNSLQGLEFAYGIPGTLGGAVSMNAGAYGGEMKDVLLECTHISENGHKGILRKNELDLSYRHSAYTDNGYTVVSAVLELNKGDKSQIKKLMDENLLKRKTKQPLEFPSAGSTFKRPEGYFAGALIEGCDLKGYTVGGAMVSEKHAGFVINKGNATSTDIITLIKDVQKIVYDKYGVMLETEVKIIGE